MKKITVLLVLLGWTQLHAQENKGKWMINGNVNYLTYKDGYNDKPPYQSQQNIYKSASVGVNLGYFLTNNFALGLSTLYTFDKIKSEYAGYPIQTYDQKNSTYSTGIFARYNQPINHSKFGFALQLDGNYGWKTGSQKQYDGQGSNTTHISSSGFSISLTPRIIYFINQKFSVETTLGNIQFRSSKGVDSYYSSQKVRRNSFDFNLNPFEVFGFGFTYYFGGKHSEDKK